MCDKKNVSLILNRTDSVRKLARMYKVLSNFISMWNKCIVLILVWCKVSYFEQIVVMEQQNHCPNGIFASFYKSIVFINVLGVE